jgi:cellulose synthase/poly-beta-1,6-N-acetylglucosamine synthase-like glycosyltransferase
VIAGHTNVFYVGDRVRMPGQLNGKSANLNHVILNKIYPGATKPSDIPMKDILMVVDCDHMCKPDIFNKMAPPMRDLRVGTALVPQWFHNLLRPVRLCHHLLNPCHSKNGVSRLGASCKRPGHKFPSPLPPAAATLVLGNLVGCHSADGRKLGLLTRSLCAL